MTTAALLALFAGVLAWPVPRLLAAARWPYRCPRAAIVLWQAVGLAGGVSALLAVIAFTVAPLSSDGIPQAMASHLGNLAAGEPLLGLGWINLIGLAAAAGLAARLFGVLCLSTAATLRERHRHRHLVDLAGHRHGAHDCDAARRGPPSTGPPAAGSDRSHPGRSRAGAGRFRRFRPGRSRSNSSHASGCCLCDHRRRSSSRLRILDHPVAVAYCVPGVRHARVVVSQGLLKTLTPEELDAVLAHEEAHVSGRHDLVIQPFVAWERTFPFLQPAREATAAVSLLVEMLADDAAARRTSSRTLARALARLGVARAPVPAGALGITGSPIAAPLAFEEPGNAAVVLPITRPAAPFSGRTPVTASVPTAPAQRAAAAQGGKADAPALPDPLHAPVVARIARLLDPPVVPFWLPGAAYLAATVTVLAPLVLLTI